MIRETFLPRLFLGKTKTLSSIVVALIMMPIRKAGMWLLNPVTSEQEKYLRSTRGSAELTQALTGGGDSPIPTTSRP